MTYDELLARVTKKVPVIETRLLTSTGLEGLCKDDFILLEKTLPSEKKKEVLAEEYGHYLTSVGNIIDYNDIGNSKQETRAREISFETLLPLDDIIDAYFIGLSDTWQVADMLGLSVQFLENALNYYRRRNGDDFMYDGYKFHFDFLGQLHIFEITC